MIEVIYTIDAILDRNLGESDADICALELERELDTKLGDWKFEIGLWVGSAATPNHIGDVTKNHPYTARYRTFEYLIDERKSSPIPLGGCPWCGEKFKQSRLS